MNYKKENYPNKVQDAIRESEKHLKSVNFKNAPRLKDIFLNESRKSIRKDFLDKETAGLYIFLDKDKPVYVGISRKVKSRLRQHAYGKTHNQATLAYLITKFRLKHNGSRSALKHEKVKPHQEEIRNYRVVVIAVPSNEYLLYFMEVYLAGKYKTHWNSFRTH